MAPGWLSLALACPVSSADAGSPQEVAEFCLFNEDFGMKYMWSCGILSVL